MKKIVLIVMTFCSAVVMANNGFDTSLPNGCNVTDSDEADTATAKGKPFSVGICMGLSYMNGIWPAESAYGEWQSDFELTGHTCGIHLYYDLSQSLSAGMGLFVRFKANNTIVPRLLYSEKVSTNWTGATYIPLTLEYHRRWFYAEGGVLLECSRPSDGPPYGSTIIKWWHGGLTASVGGCFHLTRHSIIKVGLEASAAFTPYANYARDWVGVIPSKRYYHLHTNQSYGVKIGYVYHF